MRAYVLVHSALSGIQKGIQGGHALVEMGLKSHPLYKEWAEGHKTVIFLEGGFQADLEQAEAVMKEHLDGRPEWPSRLPWAAFREDRETLNGALTAVAVILTEKIYGEQIALTTGDFETFPNLDEGQSAVWRLMWGRPLAR